MGSGASSTVFSTDDLPKQLFVEGAGSVRANGTFVLQRDNFPIKTKSSSRKGGNFAGCDRSFWFCKSDGRDCFIVYIGARKSKGGGGGDLDSGKWIICTAEDVLYMAPITSEKITPRQGRWERGAGGTAPAPTVNLQPLPAAFRLEGWKGHHDCLNGEYLPLDDGTELLNGRPIFRHMPVVGVLTHQDKWRMSWSHGAWRIRNEIESQSDKSGEMTNALHKCIAYVASDATHPTAMSADVVWKGTASGRNSGAGESDFAVVEGVTLATGNVRLRCREFDGWFSYIKLILGPVLGLDLFVHFCLYVDLGPKTKSRFNLYL